MASSQQFSQQQISQNMANPTNFTGPQNLHGMASGEHLNSGVVGTSMNHGQLNQTSHSSSHLINNKPPTHNNHTSLHSFQQIYGNSSKSGSIQQQSKFTTADSRKTLSVKNRPVQPSHQSNTQLNSNSGQGRSYHSVNKSQNGRKGQQTLQAGYFHRSNLNQNNLVSNSQEGSLQVRHQQQSSHQHGHSHLIKSYDSAQLHQQKNGSSIGVGGSNFNSNFQTLQNTSNVPTRESSLGRRGPSSNLPGNMISRQKNNSTTANSSNIGSLNVQNQRDQMQHIQHHTPQASNIHGFQGSNSNTIDMDHQRPVVHRRGGQSIPEKRSPTKQVNQISLKYQTQPYNKNQDGRRSTNLPTGPTGMKDIQGKNIPSQSLDMQMAKRKASNDDTRFKNNNRYQNFNSNSNVMAPFLDHQIDYNNQGAASKSKQMQGKERQVTPQLNDQGRPKTSTGLRGAGIFHKINQMEDTGITGQNHLPINSVNLLPTKTPNIQSTKQTNQANKFEKNDNLRTQLRRSYDANSGPHQHGIQPISNYEKAKNQNRPHSSTKINSQINQKQGMPTQNQNTQQMQNQFAMMNERPPNGNGEKQKRKRDFSKVIDMANKALNTTINSEGGYSSSNMVQKASEPQRTIDASSKMDQFTNQPLKDQMGQFNTIQPPSDKGADKSKLLNKIQKKQHLRSLTSHKIVNPTKPIQIRKEDMHRERDNSLNVTKGQQSMHQTIEDRPRQTSDMSMPNYSTATSGSNPANQRRKMPSEERQNRGIQQREGSRGEDKELRASITREVTTSKPIPQPAQGPQTQKKFDNCVTKFSFATKTGFSPKNPNKVNQDSYLVLPHLGEYRRTHFFSVCDGHGVFGKEVSEFVKTQLGYYVEQSIKNTFDQAKVAQRVVDSTEVKEQLNKSFVQVQDTLFRDSKINLRFSGSTCVSVLIVGTKVFCANVGDSRAVLVRTVGQADSLAAIPLNRDHKADEPDEEARILRNGGRVQPYRDMHGNPLGPLRVWHLKEDIPGLAMTRSFGDQAAAQVGVIAAPEILEMNLLEGDHFIILASDGVWEFISNEEAANIIMPHYKSNSAEKAAEAIIKEAIKRWQEEDTSIDDITCIIIFLNIA